MPSSMKQLKTAKILIVHYACQYVTHTLYVTEIFYAGADRGDFERAVVF
jgi:hypothetical protein